MTSLYYLPTQNEYLGKFGFYSEEEIEYADQLEKEWRATQLKLNFHQLLKIFPMAKTIIKRNLLKEIQQCKHDIYEARLLYNKYTHQIIPQTRAEYHWFLFICRDFCVAELTKGCEQKIKKNYFYLSALKPFTTTSIKDKITPEDILCAKEMPIDIFLEVNRSGFARCPFHEDKTPSLKVYKNPNRWWCYAENIGGDIIDLYMKLNNCDFITAVKKLINK